MKWHCSSSLCFNNFSTKDKDGKPIGNYRLPRDEVLQCQYKKLFKTSGMNWKSGRICASHWTNGLRPNASTLPDIIVPVDQLEKLKEKFESAKVRAARSKATSEDRMRLVKAKSKYKAALAIVNNPTVFSSSRRVIVKQDLHAKEKETNISKENQNLSLEEEVKRLKTALFEKSLEIDSLKKENDNLNSILKTLQDNHFNYETVSKDLSKFHYLTGLSIDQFILVKDCVDPYKHLILYPDCKSATRQTVDFNTQLMAVLVICRHGLDLSFMAYLLKRSVSTVHRIFVGIVVFMATVFNRLNLNLDQHFLKKNMPEIFIKTGHGFTDIVIDATEFKFESSSNFELNSLMFSNYKNTTTGKALIGISPHGMGMFFSDVYPGSISDSEITEKCNVIQMVHEGHEIMSDRGFAIQDLCSERGITLNRPKQKDIAQFTESDVQKNFDIAATRIHVERFIGRVRKWKILNNIWPLVKMDLLSSTWQTLCHIVNLTMPPIGPKK